MNIIDKVLPHNFERALNYDPERISPRPRLGLAVIACMDTRITLHALGLEPQDAHFIRNAWGIVTHDVLRSLLVSHCLLGTTEVMLINHTDCGLMKANEEEVQDICQKQLGRGVSSEFRFHAFRDVEDNVREQLAKLAAHNWIREKLSVRGFVFDVKTGRLKEVQR